MILDFAALEPPDSPNWYLACPPQESRAACGGLSPIFEMSARELAAKAADIWLEEPRTKLLRRDEAARQLELEQRSAIFRFQDVIVAEFIDRGDGNSTLYLYSRSLTGYWDLGVNGRRVRAWLELLERSLQP